MTLAGDEVAFLRLPLINTGGSGGSNVGGQGESTGIIQASDRALVKRAEQTGLQKVNVIAGSFREVHRHIL